MSHSDAFETTDLVALTVLPPLSLTPVARPPSTSTSSTCAFISTRPPCFLMPLHHRHADLNCMLQLHQRPRAYSCCGSAAAIMPSPLCHPPSLLPLHMQSPSYLSIAAQMHLHCGRSPGSFICTLGIP